MQADVAHRYARALLSELGAPVVPGAGEGLAPDLAWARSGAMYLTGHEAGPPLLAPGPLASAAEGAARALRGLAPDCGLAAGVELPDGAGLLGEKAARQGLRRRGRTAPGGRCRLGRCADGWLALHLARPDDAALLPAWLEEGEPGGDTWPWLERALASRSAPALVGRAREIGLPAALAASRAAASGWLRVAASGPARGGAPDAAPLVVDLSALWAGPLCGELLAATGARVIKVECRRRPDAARRGDPELFSLWNGSKESVALDFTDAGDLRRLRALVAAADVVIESTRPRALSQLGIDAAGFVARGPGRVWTSLTAYGRGDPEAGWVGFGDDAAVAAGLATATGDARGPLFCGDAIADPLAGLHAAVATLSTWRSRRGALLDVALRDVVAHALHFPAPTRRARVEGGSGRSHEVVLGEHREPVSRPRARPVVRTARRFGADTGSVLRELAC